MATLKEQIQYEALSFLNPNEFGEPLLVDGLECLGLWDEENQATKQFESATDIMGVFTISRMLMVMPKNQADTLPLPLPEEVLDIDGVLWTVKDATPEYGIIKLTIYRNAS